MTAKQNSLYWREWAAVHRIAPDIERHDLHAQALGRNKSHKDFTNADFDKVLAAFRAITRPDSLTAQVRQQQQPRDRVLWWIRNHCALNYVTALARERFGTENWESLPWAQLQQLHITLKNRPNRAGSSRREEAQTSFAQTAPEDDNTPF